jgi:hypothetical protein
MSHSAIRVLILHVILLSDVPVSYLTRRYIESLKDMIKYHVQMRYWERLNPLFNWVVIPVSVCHTSIHSAWNPCRIPETGSCKCSFYLTTFTRWKKTPAIWQKNHHVAESCLLKWSRKYVSRWNIFYACSWNYIRCIP